MTKKYFFTICFLLSVTFIFWCLGAERIFAQDQDTADVRILYKSSYPDRFAEVEVWLANPVPIAGFEFTITLSNHELFDFHTDSIRVQDVLLEIDTCTWEPDTSHGDTCFVDSLIPTPVRFCYIDTVGSLISEFQIVECHGDTGDTSLPYCKSVKILAMGQLVGDSIYIPEDPSYRLLLKLGVDVFCLPDSVTDRMAFFLMSPQGNSFLSDRQGNVVPFRYHRGNFDVVRGVWGDASGDSVVNMSDPLWMISYLYKNGPAPCIPETGDPSGDCEFNMSDLLWLISYLYKNGPAPNPGCWYGK